MGVGPFLDPLDFYATHSGFRSSHDPSLGSATAKGQHILLVMGAPEPSVVFLLEGSVIDPLVPLTMLTYCIWSITCPC